MSENKVCRILFGINGMEENDAKILITNLESFGIQIEAFECRYQKIGIAQCLSENNYDVVILSQHLEKRSPYNEHDFELMADNYENVRLIPILENSASGGSLVTGLFQVGIYTGLFDADAGYKNLAEMIKNGRSRKDARLYYNISEQTESMSVLDYNSSISYLEECDLEMVEERVLHILKMVSTTELRAILGKLSRERYAYISTLKHPDIAVFFGENKNVMTEKKNSIGTKETKKKEFGGVMKHCFRSIVEGGKDFMEHLVDRYVQRKEQDACDNEKIKKEHKLSFITTKTTSSVIGTRIYFVTGLKSGCGKTHFSASLANYLSGRGNTCIITRHPEQIAEMLYDTVQVGTEIMDLAEFGIMQYIIYDGTDVENLSEMELQELARANCKIMMAWADDNYMRNLANYIQTRSDSGQWSYVFNNVPDSKISYVRKIMNAYMSCYLPVYDVFEPGKDVKKMFDMLSS